MQPGLALAVELVEAEDGVRAVAGKTRTGTVTRLILRWPFQVGRAAMSTSPGSPRTPPAGLPSYRFEARGRTARGAETGDGAGRPRGRDWVHVKKVRRPRWGYLARAAPSCPIASKPERARSGRERDRKPPIWQRQGGRPTNLTCTRRIFGFRRRAGMLVGRWGHEGVPAKRPSGGLGGAPRGPRRSRGRPGARKRRLCVRCSRSRPASRRTNGCCGAATSSSSGSTTASAP